MNPNIPPDMPSGRSAPPGQMRWRKPVLVTGSADDTLACVMAWQSKQDLDVLWLSVRAPDKAWVLPAGKANHELGREADAVVVDLFSGLAVDAVAALAGCVRAGGWLILLAPPLEEWTAFDDPEYQRLTVEPFGVGGVRRHFMARSARLWATDSRVVRHSAAVPLPPLSVSPSQSPAAQPTATPGQAEVIASIVQRVASRHCAPVVVQADRGRGKSAALGMVAAQLQDQGYRVCVTAPRPEAAETLLRFAATDDRTAPAFFAPDALVQTLPEADVILVDEAAALAPALLLPLLRHYRWVVLATTVQGYEGTGQGFLLRFSRHLDREFPGWLLLKLEQPLRWDHDDPLDGFVNDWLLLNACAEPPSPPVSGLPDLTLREITPELSRIDEPLLRGVHGLLVSAHYRTRPSDARTLLDGPNMRTWVVEHQHQVIAVVMLAEEGSLPPSLCDAIIEGRRRPHGHVLAQSLAVHLNVADALREKSWRVVRIAVHSQWQRHGVGRWLLQRLEQQARNDGVSLLGSVFAASDDVLAFWHQCGYHTVRVGINREATSGAYPAVVLRPIHRQGQALYEAARTRFEHTFPCSLADTPAPWPATLVVNAWQHAQFVEDEPLSPGDQIDLNQFLAGVKTYENAAAALFRATLRGMHAGDLRQLTAAQQTLVIGKILQKQRWPALIAAENYSGQKQIRAALRDAIAALAAL